MCLVATETRGGSLIPGSSFHELPCISTCALGAESWSFWKGSRCTSLPQYGSSKPQYGFCCCCCLCFDKMHWSHQRIQPQAAMLWAHQVKLQYLKINSSGLKQLCCVGGRMGSEHSGKCCLSVVCVIASFQE